MSTGDADPAALLAEWSALADVSPGDRLYRSRRLSRPAGIDLRLGLRETDRAPCMIAAPGAATDALSTFETGGLRLSRAADPAGILLVLSLEEPSRRDLFAEICSDVVRSLVRSEDEGEIELLPALGARLAAWRAFLRDQAGALARHELVGLIGELLILDDLLDRTSEALQFWKSPDDGLHDFERAGHSVEVKASLGAARQLHISALDQLDAAGLASLDIAHVRLIEQSDGETAGEIAARIAARLSSDRDRREFANALLRRGLAPGSGDDMGPRIRHAGTDFYAVRDGFPCLRRADVPAAIVEAAYEIEVRSISAFLSSADDALNCLGGLADG